MIENILPEDTLETGFRTKANNAFDEIINDDPFIEAGVVKFPKHGGSEWVMDLSSLYYTKDQVLDQIAPYDQYATESLAGRVLRATFDMLAIGTDTTRYVSTAGAKWMIENTATLVDDYTIGIHNFEFGNVYLKADGNTNVGVNVYDGTDAIIASINSEDTGWKLLSEQNEYTANFDFANLVADVNIDLNNLATTSLSGSWNLDGNALTASKGLGTTTAQDWTLIHESDTIATIKSGGLYLSENSIIGLRSDTYEYAIQYRDLDFRLIGSNDSSVQRLFSFGHYTSNITSGTWNSRATINSYTGGGTFLGNVGVVNASPSTYLSVGTVSSALVTESGTQSITASTNAFFPFSAESSQTQGSGSGSFIATYQNGGSVMLSGARLGGFTIGGAASSTKLVRTIAITGFAEENWVDNSAYGSYIQFATSSLGATPRTEKMRLTANGNLGISTTTPSEKLEVNGKVKATTGIFTDLTANYVPKHTSGGLANSLIYDNGTNIGIRTATSYASLHVTYAQGTEGYTALGTSATGRSMMISNSNPLYGLHIGVSSDGNSWIQAGRRDNTTAYNLILQHEGGRLGVGTTTPNVFTEISSTDAGVSFRVNSANAAITSGNYSEIQLCDNSSVRSYWRNLRDGSGATIFSYNDHIRFQQGSTEYMRLTLGGNLGIGVNPSYKLDVSGTGHFTGAVTFDTVPSSLQDATTSNHLVRYSQWIAATAIKYLPTAVKTVSLTNITLSGTQTVNGVALIATDRILVAGQTAGAENGVYVVAAGSWTRATDSDTDGELRGYIVSVSNGTYAGYKYINTNASTITVGTTAITYSEFSNNIEIDPVFTAWRDTTRTANTFWATPNGSNGVATWRALVAADVPTLNQSTTGSAATLTTTRTIALSGDATWSVSFNGSANVTSALTLATVNSNVGTFRSVTVNAKGLVTAATNPTTLSGYGITDVYTKTEVYTQTESDGLFVHLIGDEEIDGIKEFYDEIKVKSNQVHLTSDFLNRGGIVASYGVLSNKLGAGGLILDVKSTGGLYFRADTTRKGLFDTNGLILSSSLGNSDVPTERLDVRGNIRYDTLLKPNNIAGTNGQFLGTSGTQDVWTTLTTSHISNLSSYTGFDSRYFTETEANGRFVDFDTDQNINGIKSFADHINIGGSFYGEGIYNISGTNRTFAKISSDIGLVLNAGTRGMHFAEEETVYMTTRTAGVLIGTALNKNTFASEKLQVNGNIRYNTLLKPNNVAGTNGQVLGTNGTQDSWVTLSTPYISDLNSYASFINYYTKTATDTLLSGKQDALPSGTSGQFLVKDSAGNLNFMDLKIRPIGLSLERIGVGNTDNYLGEQPHFLFKDKRHIQIARITDTTKQLNLGLVKKSNNGFIEQVGGSLNITATGGLYMTDFASPNRPLSMLTIDSLGKLSVSSIAGGGAVQSSLTSTHVGFGVNNVLSSSANFTFLSDRYLHFTGASANVNIGATSSGTAGFLESVNGNLLLQASSTFGVVVDDGFFQVNDLAGTGTRMVVADSSGVLSTQTIPSGGSSQDIDDVLTVGNIVAEQSLIFNNTTSDYLTLNNASGTLKGSLSLDGGLYLVSSGVALDVIGDTALRLLSDGEINIGYSNTTGIINLQGMPFNFNEESQNHTGTASGSQWGSGFNQGAPQAGDRMLFYFDGTRWVPSHIHTYAGAGGKTYLTID